jgi:hypothetical protein
MGHGLSFTATYTAAIFVVAVCSTLFRKGGVVCMVGSARSIQDNVVSNLSFVATYVEAY